MFNGAASQTLAPAPRSSYAHPAAQPGHQHSLLELPAAWLDQVPAALTPKARLSLFRTCRSMRDLMLVIMKLRLSFQLPNTPGAEDMPCGRHSTLVAALKRSPGITLQLTPGHADIAAPGSAGYGGPPASNIMPREMVALASGLAAVKTVQMECLVLDTLVPSWLALTCPNMTRLEVTFCRYSQLQPSRTVSIPVCGQLKHLLVSDTYDFAAYPPLLCWQLCLLPGLESIELRCGQYWQSHQKQQACSTLLECCAEAHTHLPRQSITELTLDKLKVTDADMEELLSIPSLRRLQCKAFQLRSSYSHRSCRWTHLTLQELDIASFACLPLESLESLQLCAAQDTATHITACSDLAATTRAVAAISRCGGVQWDVAVGTGEPARRVEADVWVSGNHAGCVPTLLPLLSAFRTSSIRFTRISVGRAMLAAIKQHLATLPIEMGPGPYTQGFRVNFTLCSFGPDAWAELLPSLPAWVQHVQLEAVKVEGGPVTVQLLARMCAAACRPITVHLDGADTRLGDGWEQEVQAAMVAGHQHVQLTSK